LTRAAAQDLLDQHPHVDAGVDEVQALLDACTPRAAPQGAQLCAEGDPGDELWFVLEGRVQILKRDLHGVQRPMGEVGAPTLLGQMGIIDRARRSATCVAATPVRLAVMDRATCSELVRELSGRGVALRRLLLSSLTLQLVEGNGRLRALSHRAADDETASLDPVLDERLLAAAGALQGWAASPR
jgi:CRP-like cAMP-binding protein